MRAAQVGLHELERHRPVARDRARSPRGRARSSSRAVWSNARRWSAESRANEPGGSLAETAIRNGAAGGVWAASRNVPRGGATLYASPGAEPCITSSSSALSATVRASAPKVASPSQPSPSGCEETRPRVGFMPTSPQQAAGIRIEPPPSDAPAAGTRPAATAAAEPPDEPPGVRDRSHGLRVTPPASLAVHGNSISSGTRVIPIGIAPASRSRRSASASSGCGCAGDLDPRVVACPANGMSSLMAIGTPARAPRPSIAPPSICDAVVQATSGSVSRNAFRRGSSRSMRASDSSTSSRALISRSRTRRDSSSGPANASSFSSARLTARQSSRSWSASSRLRIAGA